MAELLIRTQDQDGTKPYLRGDVIYIGETEYEWSNSEKNAVFNMVLVVTGLGASVFDQFTEEVYGDNQEVLKRRKYYLDIDGLTEQNIADLANPSVPADDKLNIIVTRRRER